MRKLLFFLVFAICLLALANPSYALLCKMGQGPGDSDECWSEIKIDEGYMTLVSEGHVLVVSYGLAVANNDGQLAKLSGASADEEILGVAQGSIASGDRAMVLVRGVGEVKFANVGSTGIASGDILGVMTSGTAVEVASTSHLGKGRFAVALEATEDTAVGSEGNLKSYVMIL